ncbi:MAG: hypothetical protein P4L36_10295 [Holophaga sp.]|nr:hypothetical protein [Holophaga sp.]
MLERLIYADWETPPDAMNFEGPLCQLLDRIQELLPGVLAGRDAALQDPASAPPAYWDDCLALYLVTPALVNVALNYKICVEQGLPLHPSHYFEVNERTRFKKHYPPATAVAANRHFLDSIATARAVYALDPHAPERVEAFRKELPPILHGFIYASVQDKYTWRASDPGKIKSLATQVGKAMRPAVIVGAAHGSIMSGLVFANLMDAPLYFIRFSMFKRHDTVPIIAGSDLDFLRAYQAGPALLFDEDVAKGTTLTRFGDALRPLFQASSTASVLRHSLSPCWPDFTGHAWND